VGHLVAWIYLAGWPIATIVVFALSHWLHDRRYGAPHTLSVSVAAGGVWPLLTLGLIQCGVLLLVLSLAKEKRRNTGESACAGDNPDSRIDWTERDATWGTGSRL
jgi:hypothetical protein